MLLLSTEGLYTLTCKTLKDSWKTLSDEHIVAKYLAGVGVELCLLTVSFSSSSLTEPIYISHDGPLLGNGAPLSTVCWFHFGPMWIVHLGSCGWSKWDVDKIRHLSMWTIKSHVGTQGHFYSLSISDIANIGWELSLQNNEILQHTVFMFWWNTYIYIQFTICSQPNMHAFGQWE